MQTLAIVRDVADIQVTGSEVCFPQGPGNVTALRKVPLAGGTDETLPFSGGAPQMLGTAECGISSLASDGVNLSWGSRGACDCSNRGMLGRIPVAGGTSTIMASVAGPADELRPDATHLYFVDGSTVARMPP